MDLSSEPIHAIWIDPDSIHAVWMDPDFLRKSIGNAETIVRQALANSSLSLGLSGWLPQAGGERERVGGCPTPIIAGGLFGSRSERGVQPCQESHKTARQY